MEANKFILNKLNELSIKCSFFQQGCNFISKLSEIEKHEEGCNFKQQVSSICEETNSNFHKMFRNCPVSKIQCELACKFNVKSQEVSLNALIYFELKGNQRFHFLFLYAYINFKKNIIN